MRVRHFKPHLLICFICIFSFINAHSQNESIDQLAFYADVLTNASSAEHRVHANRMFLKELQTILADDESFKNALENVPWIFVRYAPSRKFRFISWQVDVGQGKFKYHTFYQNNLGDIIEIKGDQEEIELRAGFPLEDAYRSIIHQIIPVDDYFLLAAFKQLSDGSAMKICEVLSFDSGRPQLGKSIFYEDESIPEGRGKKRVIMRYSPVASASMNINVHDAERVIVYDHIIPVPGKTAQEGMINVPDGSYEAYVQSAPNRWLYNPNLYEGLEYNPKTQSRPQGRLNKTGVKNQ